MRLLEVKVDEERFDKVGDGIAILVLLLSHHPHQILDLLLVVAVRVALVLGAGSVAVGDDGSSQVSQDPRTRGLDGVDVWRREEELGEDFSGGLVVEEGEQTPVDEPCAVLQLGERVVEESRVDALLDFGDLLHRAFPVGGQDVARELAPCGGVDAIIVGGQDTVLVEKLGGGRVVSARVLELAEVVELLDHGGGHAVVVLEVVHVALLVAAEIIDDFRIGKQVLQLLSLLLILLPLLQDLFPLLGVFLRALREVVQLSVQVANEVVHICLLEQRELEVRDVRGVLIFGRLLLEEVEEWEDEVAVEVGDEVGEDGLLFGDVCRRLRRVVGGLRHVGWSGICDSHQRLLGWMSLVAKFEFEVGPARDRTLHVFGDPGKRDEVKHQGSEDYETHPVTIRLYSTTMASFIAPLLPFLRPLGVPRAATLQHFLSFSTTASRPAAVRTRLGVSQTKAPRLRSRPRVARPAVPQSNAAREGRTSH